MGDWIGKALFGIGGVYGSHHPHEWKVEFVVDLSAYNYLYLGLKCVYRGWRLGVY
jgi:hypothetical protein